MALPHPESGQDDCGNGDKANDGRVIWNLVKRTIDVTDYGNGEDDVDPAKNRTSSGATDHLILLLLEDSEFTKSQCRSEDNGLAGTVGWSESFFRTSRKIL